MEQLGQENTKPAAAAVGGDHFVVEDLLDFSNEEEEEEEGDNGANGNEDDGGCSEAVAGNNLAYSSTVTAVDSCNSSFSGDPVSLSVAVEAGLSSDLCEPYDDLAELEWLSNFVEESFSSEDLQKLQLISGVKSLPGSASGSGSGSGSSSSETRELEVPSSESILLTSPHQLPTTVPFFLPESTTVPGKARSKRSRAAPCSWSSRLLVLSDAATTSDSDSDSILLTPITVKKSQKPTKKKELGLNGPALMAAAPDGRRCLHCDTDKTPQWRTGPMGPKTLCNACGVRYKSGRLVPEYRPASSPTFVLSKHSNSHRKVLELRRQKEMQHQQQPFMSPVGSFFDGGVEGSASAVAGNADEFLIHHHLGPDFRQLI